MYAINQTCKRNQGTMSGLLCEGTALTLKWMVTRTVELKWVKTPKLQHQRNGKTMVRQFNNDNSELHFNLFPIKPD